MRGRRGAQPERVPRFDRRLDAEPVRDGSRLVGSWRQNYCSVIKNHAGVSVLPKLPNLSRRTSTSARCLAVAASAPRISSPCSPLLTPLYPLPISWPKPKHQKVNLILWSHGNVARIWGHHDYMTNFDCTKPLPCKWNSL